MVITSLINAGLGKTELVQLYLLTIPEPKIIAPLLGSRIV